MADKIAIVEDDQVISQMYRLKLEAEGYQVQVANNGEVGLAMIEAMRPDVVLLDLMMPEMNGDEMLEKMRATDWGKQIRVIVLTNVDDQKVTESMKQAGIAGLIIKAQMTPSEVVKKIQQVLSTDKV